MFWDKWVQDVQNEKKNEILKYILHDRRKLKVQFDGNESKPDIERGVNSQDYFYYSQIYSLCK